MPPREGPTMLRATTAVGVLVICGLASWGQTFRPGERFGNQSNDFYPRKLQRRVRYSGVDDPKSTFVDVLDQISRDYNLVYDVNERAFKYENVMDVLKTQIA